MMMISTLGQHCCYLKVGADCRVIYIFLTCIISLTCITYQFTPVQLVVVITCRLEMVVGSFMCFSPPSRHCR